MSMRRRFGALVVILAVGMTGDLFACGGGRLSSLAGAARDTSVPGMPARLQSSSILIRHRRLVPRSRKPRSNRC